MAMSSHSPAAPAGELPLGPQTLHCDVEEIFKLLFFASGKFYKYNSMDLKFITERVINGLAYNSRCSASSFT